MFDIFENSDLIADLLENQLARQSAVNVLRDRSSMDIIKNIYENADKTDTKKNVRAVPLIIKNKTLTKNLVNVLHNKELITLIGKIFPKINGKFLKKAGVIGDCLENKTIKNAVIAVAKDDKAVKIVEKTIKDSKKSDLADKLKIIIKLVKNPTTRKALFNLLTDFKALGIVKKLLS